MARIIFAPTCSKCNKVINQTIEFNKEDIFPAAIYAFMRQGTRTISPERCPYCGEPFTGIIIPQDLPFDVRDYLI